MTTWLPYQGLSITRNEEALGGLTNKVFASRYKLQLPDPKVLAREIEAERRRLEQRLHVSPS